MYLLGVDVGGTNSDAVAILNNDVVASAKRQTSEDVTEGVSSVLKDVLSQLEPKAEIKRLSIGTTHFVNAFVQRKGLSKVSVVRLCGNASKALPPFSNIENEEILRCIKGDFYLVNGGFQVDSSLISEVQRDEIIKVCESLKAAKVNHVVISGVYSLVNPEQEIQVQKCMLNEIPELSITLSHQIGDFGLLERENAAILNESLKPLCRKTLKALLKTIRGLDLHCPVFLTQNDGTCSTLSECLHYPIKTFASGPTNSMRGAAFLAFEGLVENAIVAYIGGTTTDVGHLIDGFPRYNSSTSDIGGVSTNFRMPAISSSGLGGGSIITKADSGLYDIGPSSVGAQSTHIKSRKKFFLCPSVRI